MSECGDVGEFFPSIDPADSSAMEETSFFIAFRSGSGTFWRMESLTFRSRLLKLLQKTRKAVRLYSSIDTASTRERVGEEGGYEFRALQLEEWRRTTQELLQSLSVALEQPQARRLASDVFSLRDRFHADWRHAEAELHALHRDVSSAVEHEDYMKVAQGGQHLVKLKARVQACQAAHHELQEVIDRSKISEPDTITLEASQEVLSEGFEQSVSRAVGSEAQGISSIAKVIPLRRKRVLGG